MIKTNEQPIIVSGWIITQIRQDYDVSTGKWTAEVGGSKIDTKGNQLEPRSVIYVGAEYDRWYANYSSSTFVEQDFVDKVGIPSATISQEEDFTNA